MKLPNRYVSEATLLVVQQKVSQRYVEPDNTTTISGTIQAMKLEVLSRARLLGIINDLGLYRKEKERFAPELLVDQMRKDVDIQPLETTPGRNDFDAFTIAFTADTPQLAQEVTSRLTSLFIEQNLKTRGEQAANTTKFLSDQLEAAKQRLAEQEQRLQAFKASNMGELPEQQQANLIALTEVRARLETVASSFSQAQQQQSSLELSLSDRLGRLQSEKTALLLHYTPRYPEVMKKDHEIAKVQSVLERLTTGTPSPGAQEPEPTDDPSLGVILRQAEANVAQMASLSKQHDKLREESEQYQSRLNLTPLREQQLAEILRDDDLYKKDYTDLLNKKLQSQMTTTLEEKQEGQQFQLVDPPSLPVKPASPKRLKISLGGLSGGILLGLALGFLIDMRDTSFHSEKTLSDWCSLPLVMGMPLVPTPLERRLRGWKVAFECLVGCVMILALCTAELYVIKNR
jgi:polysaccharide biosynthesis transport protein